MLVTHFCCVLNSFYILFPSCVNMQAFSEDISSSSLDLCFADISLQPSTQLLVSVLYLTVLKFPFDNFDGFWVSPGILQIFFCFLDILSLIILNILPKNSSIWIIYGYVSIYLYFSSSPVHLSVFWCFIFWLDMWVKIKVFPFKMFCFLEKRKRGLVDHSLVLLKVIWCFGMYGLTQYWLFPPRA